MQVPVSATELPDMNKAEEDKANKMKRKLPLQCRVQGCGSDLAPLKVQNKADYRVRYKICDEHLKALEVLHEGKMMRFCQQCTSLHETSCFDGNKRSCRERLTSHNARRRKKRQPAAGEGAAKGGGAAAAAAPAVGLDALQSLISSGGLAGLSSGTANNAVLGKIYELLAANHALPAAAPAASAAPSASKPPELNDPNSAQLLKSAADMLGSMGATGVQSAVAALQSKPAAAPAQLHQPPGSVEQLNELLGTYSQLIGLQQGGAQPGLSSLLPTSAAQQRPAADTVLLANLATSGLLGAGLQGGSPSQAPAAAALSGGLASAIAQQLSQFASGMSGNH